MAENFNVKIWHQETNEVKMGFLSYSVDNSVTVKLERDARKTLTVQGEDLFAALVEVRRVLESTKEFLLCNCSRVDITPSGMSREFSRGRFAYKLQLGKQALKRDIIDVLDEVDDGKIGTVSDQEDFYKKWVRSISGE